MYDVDQYYEDRYAQFGMDYDEYDQFWEEYPGDDVYDEDEEEEYEDDLLDIAREADAEAFYGQYD
jgi:hypothetical protein